MSGGVDVLQNLLAGTDPLLMEVGATERPEEIWDGIAPWSTYCGLGPALQILDTPELQRYRERKVFNEIIVPDKNAGSSNFYATRDPIYSSLLPPDASAISEYSDLRDVTVVETRTVQTVGISDLLDRASVSRIDWFKTNVNGVDVRIFESLQAEIRDRILAMDTVLDFVPLCVSQDDTLMAHPNLLRRGFWLSRLSNWGGVRMRAESATELQRRGIEDPVLLATKYHRHSPGWAFARYFRTVDSLEQGSFERRDYAVLWSFAYLDDQLGFCADLALSYQRRFGSDEKSELMLQEVTRRMSKLSPPEPTIFVKGFRKFLPDGLRRRLKALVFGA